MNSKNKMNNKYSPETQLALNDYFLKKNPKNNKKYENFMFDFYLVLQHCGNGES